MKTQKKITFDKYIQTLRDGFKLAISIILIGYVILIPIIILQQWFPEIGQILNIARFLTFGIIALYITFGITLNLAKLYNLHPISSALLSIFSLVMATKVFSEKRFAFENFDGTLQGNGIFMGILIACITIEIIRLCKKYGLKLKKHSEKTDFTDIIIPAFILIGIIWFVIYFLELDVRIITIVTDIIDPFFHDIRNTIWLPLLFVLCVSIMKFVGISYLILIPTMFHIWTNNLSFNMNAFMNGQLLSQINVADLIYVFSWIGGCGGTLALCIYMCFSKSKQLKKLGLFSIIPSIFNINDPILFGSIVFNKILFIPFLLTPIVSVIISYTAFASRIVRVPFHLTPYTTPSIIAGFISTVSFSGVILIIVNFIISALIYYPFFKKYEKQLIDEENGLYN